MIDKKSLVEEIESEILGLEAELMRETDPLNSKLHGRIAGLKWAIECIGWQVEGD